MTLPADALPVRRALRPFLDPPSVRSIGILAVASACSGLAEAGALVMLTGTGIAVSRSSGTVELGPYELEWNIALLLGAAFLVIKLALAVLTSWLGSKLAAGIYQRVCVHGCSTPTSGRRGPRRRRPASVIFSNCCLSTGTG